MGLGLVDTLWKYLEGAAIAWEVTEPVTDRITTTDLRHKVVRHASNAIKRINTAGGRATQPAKRTAWESLSEGFSEQVASFVVAIVDGATVDHALAELGLETFDD